MVGQGKKRGRLQSKVKEAVKRGRVENELEKGEFMKTDCRKERARSVEITRVIERILIGLVYRLRVYKAV